MRDAILEEGGQGDCECWKMSILRRARMFDVRLERIWGRGVIGFWPKALSV